MDHILCVNRCFPEIGVPLNYPLDGILHFINPPFWIPPFMETPTCFFRMFDPINLLQKSEKAAPLRRRSDDTKQLHVLFEVQPGDASR